MRHGVDNDRTKVSILIPCFNEEANVGSVYAAVTGVFRTLPDYDYEIIFTANHSTASNFALLRDMAAREPKVQDRRRVVRGKEVSGRVGSGGGGSMKQKEQIQGAR